MCQDLTDDEVDDHPPHLPQELGDGHQFILGVSAFLTTGCLLKASSAGPVAAHTKSGPRMPASQKSWSCFVMFVRMSLKNGVVPTGTGRWAFLADKPDRG